VRDRTHTTSRQSLLASVVEQAEHSSAHRPEELAAVAFNSRPRKTLAWRTPAEALNDHLPTSSATEI